jgi:hypothetical protein
MKKALLIAAISLSIHLGLYAQRTINVDSVSGHYDIGAFFSVVNGEPFATAKFIRLVEGSAFFKDDWNIGNVTLLNGASYSNISLRINLLDKQLHFLKDGTEFIADKFIKEVSFADKKTGDTFVFRTGFPPVPGSSPRSLFQVLADGKAQFLKLYNKDISESKPYGSATYEQRVITNSAYYILKNNEMVKVKNDRETIESVLADKQHLIKEFLSKNKLNFRNEKDIVTLLRYYNSL